MTDPDRERVVVPDEPRVEHHTTVVDTGRGGGGGGALAAIVLVLIVVVLLFLYFGGYLSRVAGRTDINVNVAAPKVELPDVKIDTPAAQPANKTQ
jgi:predicted metalloprotease